MGRRKVELGGEELTSTESPSLERLREVVERYEGLTHRVVAEWAGVKIGTYYAWLEGRHPDITAPVKLHAFMTGRIFAERDSDGRWWFRENNSAPERSELIERVADMQMQLHELVRMAAPFESSDQSLTDTNTTITFATMKIAEMAPRRRVYKGENSVPHLYQLYPTQRRRIELVAKDTGLSLAEVQRRLIDLGLEQLSLEAEEES